MGSAMARQGKTALLLLFLAAAAPRAPAQEGSVEYDDVLGSSARDFAIIGGTTGLGALLGASTLSFVDRPKRHLRRILTGGAAGLIVGVGIVAYLQANRSREAILAEPYGLLVEPPPPVGRGLSPPGAGRAPPPLLAHAFPF